MGIEIGDCAEILKSFQSNQFDSLVTDPPAGISFMGKSWDSDKGGRDSWIAWMTSVMLECKRVMKPGAHGLIWAIPRTSHWTATALENAGFEIRDVITHHFGSGFPKSHDISKAMDKKAGADRDVIGNYQHPDGSDKRSVKSAPSINVETPRICGGDWNYSLTAPKTDLAKQWQGFGTALKPASEHWILVRKPCSEKTVAKNVEKWGCGGVNIDASRIEFKTADRDAYIEKRKSFGNSEANLGWKMFSQTLTTDEYIQNSSNGRFPANLILSHADECEEDICSLFCPIRMLDEQSGQLKNGGQNYKGETGNSMFGNNEVISPTRFANDSGGASRFFYCAKASKKDRNAGLEGMEGKNNTHPTVKSSKLMEYLCTLITPPKGKILDPFMGSGSTGVAAKRLGFEFTGIEQNEEYAEIAKKRIESIL